MAFNWGYQLSISPFRDTLIIGLPYLEKQKSGRSNSAVDLSFEGGDQLLQKKKKKVITCLAARFVSFLGRK